MRTRVFISYSHKDRAWLERLKVFLRPLERDGLIDRWDDSRLVAGDDWRAEIRDAVSTARVIVLLVSADFLASDFIDKEELPPLLEQAAAQGARIIPVIVGSCMLDGPNAPLARYQAINSPSNPLENQTKAERNRVWTKLTEQIVAELSRRPCEPSPVAEVSVADNTGRHALVVSGSASRDGADPASEVERVLGAAELGRFEVTTLRDAPTARVREGVRRFFLDRGPNDVALLYYSGGVVGAGAAPGGPRTSGAGDPVTLSALDLGAFIRSSPARWRVVLVDCPWSERGSGLPSGQNLYLAGLQGEGHFVLAVEEGPEAARPAIDHPEVGFEPRDVSSTLAGALVYGLQTGKADLDGDHKVSVEDLFGFIEREIGTSARGRLPARWAFDQSSADVTIADVALAGEEFEPTPIRVRDRVAQDIRHPIFDLTVPTYILDPYFFVLDWNPAFDELVAKEIKLVRGQDHARTFVQALENCDDVFRHAQEAFGGERYPLVDMEELVFRSRKYGMLRFKKVAAQIASDDGTIKGWSVSLNLLGGGGGDPMWRDLKERIEDEVGWSRYAAVYDRLLLEFPPYRQLVAKVAALVGAARRCIDLGAGTGNGSIELLTNDPDREVWAVEINETMLRHFRAKLESSSLADAGERLTVVKDDLQRLDALPRAFFDAAVMTNVLYAVRDREACLRQINRILKPSGVLALSTPHSRTSVDRLFASLRRVLELKGMFNEYREHFDAARARHDAMMDRITRDSVEDTVRLVQDAGFEVHHDEVFPNEYVGSVVVMKATKAREPKVVVAVPPVVDVVSLRPAVRALSTLDEPRDPAPSAEKRDVFVSYSEEDRDIAEAIRSYLESQEIPCWIASRDINPGANFPAAIVNAIDASRVLVLVLSNSANQSQFAAREVARAADRRIPIIPYRAERVIPSPGLALYLSNVHWLDAFDAPTDAEHLGRLSGTVKELLSSLAGELAEAEALGASEAAERETVADAQGAL